MGLIGVGSWFSKGNAKFKLKSSQFVQVGKPFLAIFTNFGETPPAY
jgi:hypothetical protein